MDAIEDEKRVDHVLLGWRGTFARNEFAFGSNLDAVLAGAPTDVTLATIDEPGINESVALVGEGPNATAAVRRAVEFATPDGGLPTLINVQSDDDQAITDDEREATADAVRRGRAIIETVAERAGLDPEEYESQVVVGPDVESAVVGAIEDGDIVCLGLSAASDLRSDPSGSLAERVHGEVSCSVAVAREGPES